MSYPEFSGNILNNFSTSLDNIKSIFPKLLPLLGVGLIVYFPLFLDLDALPLALYDESRRAVNAIEMLQQGNFIVTYFEGKPDMWGTKPPLLIYLQAICLKVFGFNELAIRLPSALAGLATVGVLIYYAWKHFNNKAWGIFASLVLVTSSGFISSHVTRTGDYDALLSLFTTIYTLCFFEYMYCSNRKAGKRLLILTAVFVSLAVLTKSIAGLLFLPGLFIFALATGKLKKIMTDRRAYLALSGIIFFVGSYYFIREQLNPGFLQAVADNELGGRYLDTLEYHKHEFSWYFQALLRKDFLPWIFVLPFSLFLSFGKSKKIKLLSLYLFTCVLSFLLIISFSATKLHWYDAPVYPLASLLVSLGIYYLFEKIQNKIQTTKLFLSFVFPVLFCLAIFGWPYKNIIDKVDQQEIFAQYEAYGSFMERIKEYDRYKIGFQGYNAHVLFYVHAYNERGSDITFQLFPLRISRLCLTNSRI